jgi:hypothetical protein
VGVRFLRFIETKYGNASREAVQFGTPLASSAKSVLAKTSGEEKAKMVVSSRERRRPEKTDLSGKRNVSLPEVGDVGWAPKSVLTLWAATVAERIKPYHGVRHGWG